MSTAAGQFDVLESGDLSRRRPGVRTVAALLVLALLAGGGWLIDQRRQRTEFDAVLSCVSTGQAALADADARISQVSNFVAPALSPGPPPVLGAGLYRLIEQAAAGTLGPVRQARARCAAVGLRPWHSRSHQARAAYLAYLDARIGQIVAIAAAGAQSFTDDAAPPALLGKARSALLAAAPSRRLARRVIAELAVGND